MKTEVDLIRKILEPQLEGDAEKITFNVQDCLIVPGFEIYLYDRMEPVNAGILHKRIETGTVDVFLQGLLYKLRNKKLNNPVLFRIIDVYREVYRCLCGICDREALPISDPVEIKREISGMVDYLKKMIFDAGKNNRILDAPIENFVHTKCSALLRKQGITKFGDLTKLTLDEIATLDGVGPDSQRRIREAFDKYDIKYAVSKSEVA